MEQPNLRQRLVALGGDLYPQIRRYVLNRTGLSATAWQHTVNGNRLNAEILTVLCDLAGMLPSALLNTEETLDRDTIINNLCTLTNCTPAELSLVISQ